MAAESLNLTQARRSAFSREAADREAAMDPFDYPPGRLRLIDDLKRRADAAGLDWSGLPLPAGSGDCPEAFRGLIRALAIGALRVSAFREEGYEPATILPAAIWQASHWRLERSVSYGQEQAALDWQPDERELRWDNLWIEPAGAEPVRVRDHPELRRYIEYDATGLPKRDLSGQCSAWHAESPAAKAVLLAWCDPVLVDRVSRLEALAELCVGELGPALAMARAGHPGDFPAAVPEGRYWQGPLPRSGAVPGHRDWLPVESIEKAERNLAGMFDPARAEQDALQAIPHALSVAAEALRVDFISRLESGELVAGGPIVPAPMLPAPRSLTLDPEDWVSGAFKLDWRPMWIVADRFQIRKLKFERAGSVARAISMAVKEVEAPRVNMEKRGRNPRAATIEMIEAWQALDGEGAFDGQESVKVVYGKVLKRLGRKETDKGYSVSTFTKAAREHRIRAQTDVNP